MAYTEQQWNNFQAALPPEDRVPYLVYLRTVDPIEYNRITGTTVANLKQDSAEPTATTVVDERTKAAGAKTDTAAQRAATIAASKVTSNFRAAEAASAKTDSAASVSVSAVESAAQERAALKAAELQAEADRKAAQDALNKKIAEAKAAAEAAAAAAAAGDPNAAALQEAADAAAADADATATLAGENSATTNAAINATNVVTQLAEPPGRPGKAWIVGADGKTWVKPAKPTDGKTYTWNDDNGWVADTGGGEPPNKPGNAWIVSPDGKSWVKPPMPTDGKTYTWDDNTGWVVKTGDTEPPNRPGKAWIVSPDGKGWVKPAKPTDGKTYFWNDDVGWVIQTTQLGGEDANAAAIKYAADKASADAAAAVQAGRLSAWATLKAEFERYGLGSLADTVKDLILNGTPAAQATMILRKSDAYKIRFAGNKMREDAGLNVYDEGTYLDLENAMAEIFVSYGQKALMGSTREEQQATFAKYIGGTIAPTELKRRMDIASTLSKSDNSTLTAIKELYPMINDKDIFSYFLKPEETLGKLETKAQAASIGGAFLAQGLKINSASMEEYAALGISREEAQLGAEKIATVLPRAAQLRAYENGTYTQKQAEDVYLRQSATAKKELEDLAKLETGRMSGASGTSKVSLKSANRNII